MSTFPDWGSDKTPKRYTVKLQAGGAWGVYWEVPNGTYSADNLLSGHGSKAEADAAKRRYVAVDARRALGK